MIRLQIYSMNAIDWHESNGVDNESTLHIIQLGFAHFNKKLCRLNCKNLSHLLHGPTTDWASTSRLRYPAKV